MRFGTGLTLHVRPALDTLYNGTLKTLVVPRVSAKHAIRRHFHGLSYLPYLQCRFTFMRFPDAGDRYTAFGERKTAVAQSLVSEFFKWVIIGWAFLLAQNSNPRVFRWVLDLITNIKIATDNPHLKGVVLERPRDLLHVGQMEIKTCYPELFKHY